MYDRIATYPGRIKLTPVEGQENVYDMVRADEPTQSGSPISAATLLSSETASLLGLGDWATPDDAFADLADRIGKQYKIVFGSYTGTGGCGKDQKNTLTFDFRPEIVVVTVPKRPGHTVTFYRSKYSGNRSTAYFNPEPHRIGSCTLVVSWTNNGLSWWATSYKYYQNYGDSTETEGEITSLLQLNGGYEYEYFAIGKGI